MMFDCSREQNRGSCARPGSSSASSPTRAASCSACSCSSAASVPWSSWRSAAMASVCCSTSASSSLLAARSVSCWAVSSAARSSACGARRGTAEARRQTVRPAQRCACQARLSSRRSASRVVALLLDRRQVLSTAPHCACLHKRKSTPSAPCSSSRSSAIRPNVLSSRSSSRVRLIAAVLAASTRRFSARISSSPSLSCRSGASVAASCAYDASERIVVGGNALNAMGEITRSLLAVSKIVEESNCGACLCGRRTDRDCERL